MGAASVDITALHCTRCHSLICPNNVAPRRNALGNGAALVVLVIIAAK